MTVTPLCASSTRFIDASRYIWMITRCEDVRHLLRHHRDMLTVEARDMLNCETRDAYILSLATASGKLHGTIRKETLPEFSKSLSERLGPPVVSIVEKLLAEFPASGEVAIYCGVILRVPQLFMTRFLGFLLSQHDRWHAIGELPSP